MAPTSNFITPAILNRIKSCPGLPDDCWYLISGAALCALNRPETVPELLQHILSGDAKEDQRVIRRLREALIKVAPIAGIPKVTLSLAALKVRTPPELLDFEPTIRTKDFVETPASEVLKRGEEFFNSTYGPKAPQTMQALNETGTPDLGAASRLIYAFYFSDTSILSGKETVLVMVTGDIVTDVQRVALSHMNGAVNQGATVDEVNAVRELVIFICEQVDMTTNGKRWRGDIAKL